MENKSAENVERYRVTIKNKGLNMLLKPIDARRRSHVVQMALQFFMDSADGEELIKACRE